MRNPPSLVSLAIDATLANLSRISDLSFLPDHILVDLFLRTLRAGKLTEKILKLFVSSGKDEVLSLIQALNIQHVYTPVLPTNAAAVKEHLGRLDPKFIRASEAMLEWVKLWKAITTCSSS